MKSIASWLTFGLLSLMLGFPAWAEPVEVGGGGVVELGPHSVYWFDASGAATWAQALRQDQSGAFRPLQRRQGNFGYRSEPIWYRFTLSNATSRPATRFLRAGLSDQASQLFQLAPEESNARLVAPWEPPSIWRLYRLTIPPGQTLRYYLRIARQERNIQASYLKLLDMPSLIGYQEQLRNLSLFVYGALFSLALYHLLLFHALRTASSLYFTGMLLSQCVALAALDGVGMRYAWPPQYNGLAAQIGSFSLGLFFTLLAQSLLETARRFPRVHRLLRAQVAGLLGLIGLSLFPLPAWATQAQAWVGALVPFVLLVAFLKARRYLVRLSNKLLAGWGLYFLSLAVMLVFIFGTPYIDLTQEETLWALRGLVLGGMLVIALVLADQIQMLNQEKVQAQAQLAEQAQGTAQQLEREVRLRTLELDDMVEKLHRLNQEKDEFLALAAHDLKTPLSNIGLFAQLLEQQLPMDGGKSEEYLKYIRHSSAEMRRLISELLDAELIEGHSTPTDLQPVPLAPIVERTLQTFRPTAQGKGLKLEASLPQRPAQILGQPNWVQLALSNLLSNALKFAPPSTAVSVALEEREGFWRLSVGDQGPGISAQDQEKLFQPFMRLEPQPADDVQSTGLGLYLVRRLQERSGGKVEVRSAPGQGATFVLTYPQVPQASGLSERAAPE